MKDDGCISTSSCTSVLRVNIDSINARYFVKNYNICEDDNLTIPDIKQNCKILAKDLNTLTNYICIECIDGAYGKEINFSTTAHSNVDVQATQQPFISKVKNFTPSIKCVSSDLINDISNCLYFNTFFSGEQNEIIACVKCIQGFTGGFHVDGYIQSCTEISQNISSDNAVKFGNLHMLWEKLFSVHQCESFTDIPVLFMEFESVSNLTPVKFVKYGFDNTGNWEGEETDSIKCLENKKESFYHSDDSESLFELPSGCAMAVVNLGNSKNKEKQGDFNPLFCAACKPKSKPITSNNDNDHFKYPYINNCEDIPNCIGIDWTNSCSQCDEVTVYEYIKDNRSIDYKSCVKHSFTEHCYAATKATEIDSSICIFCEKGFSLNEDGYCEALEPSKCFSTEHFSKSKTYETHQMGYGSYYGQQGVGCSKC